MSGALAGLRVLVSAGPTFEDIDPVRFIGNRSSGRMGFAVAEAARDAGAAVRLVAGPVALDTPAGVARSDVRSAAQMHAAVIAALPTDIYIGAAAVADFTPAQLAEQKIKKTDDGTGMTLQLVRTRDILAEVAAHAHRPRLVVGFAAETQDVETNARGKLARKRLDMICANRVGVEGSGFAAEDNTLDVYWDGGHARLGPATKREVASMLVECIAHRLQPE